MSLLVTSVFDIETYEWNKFMVGGIAYADGGYSHSRDPDELARELVHAGGECWTWNGGKYDLLWLSEWCRENGYPVTYSLSGPRITKMTAGATLFRDAIALIPFSLNQAAELLDTPLSKKEWDHDRTHPDMSELEWLEFESYLKRDCHLTLNIVEAVLKRFTHLGWKTTGTLGGSAWKTAQTRYELPPAEWEPRDYHRVREAYYGGRTQVFQPTAEHGYRCDIHSAYPAALVETPLPVGDHYALPRKDAAAAFRNGRPGIYEATVSVPECFLPPLPVRMPWDEIAYPTGHFKGSWSLLELDHAVECGADIEIISGVTWEDERIVFAEFLQEVWDVRDSVGTKSQWGKLVKLFANSLTGKFGEAPEKARVLLYPDPSKIKFCPGGECGIEDGRYCSQFKCCKHRCRNKCRKWEEIDEAGNLWSAPFYSIPSNGHVQWAAYLTSAARIELHKQLLADGEGGMSALYCDTDSVYSTSRRTRRFGDNLGEWGDDGEMTDWVCAAKKAYKFTQPDGEIYTRCKGLEGLTPEDFDAYCRGEVVERDRGVMGLRSAGRKGGSLFARKLITRSSNSDGLWFGDRTLKEDGRTYPTEWSKLWRLGNLTKRRENNSQTKQPKPAANNAQAPF